ncbi:hypothetical protein EDB84DRAFT_1435120 [Lactarius hengduanensis]|nr:hypothetical protein EDB84DRAFT_1435120 [Lactarius hengduanensis]
MPIAIRHSSNAIFPLLRLLLPLQPFASDVPPSAPFPPYSMLFGDLPFGTCDASNYPLKSQVRSALTADSHTQLPLRVPRSGVTRARGTATPTTYFNLPGRCQTFPWLALPQAQPDKRATDDQQVACQQRADFPAWLREDLAQAAPAYSSRGVTQMQAAPTPRETKAPTSARTSKSTHGNAGAIVVTGISCITTGGEGGNPVASLRSLTARCSDDKSKQLAPEVALAQGSALVLSRRVVLSLTGYGNRATKVFVLDYPPGIRASHTFTCYSKSKLNHATQGYPPEAYDCHSHRWALVFRVRQPVVNVKITRGADVYHILRVPSGGASTFSQAPKQAESRLPEMGNASYDYQDSDLTPDTTGCACLLQFRTPRPSRPIPGA